MYTHMQQSDHLCSWSVRLTRNNQTPDGAWGEKTSCHRYEAEMHQLQELHTRRECLWVSELGVRRTLRTSGSVCVCLCLWVSCGRNLHCWLERQMVLCTWPWTWTWTRGVASAPSWTIQLGGVVWAPCWTLQLGGAPSGRSNETLTSKNPKSWQFHGELFKAIFM